MLIYRATMRVFPCHCSNLDKKAAKKAKKAKKAGAGATVEGPESSRFSTRG